MASRLGWGWVWGALRPFLPPVTSAPEQHNPHTQDDSLGRAGQIVHRFLTLSEDLRQLSRNTCNKIERRDFSISRLRKIHVQIKDQDQQTKKTKTLVIISYMVVITKKGGETQSVC